MIRWYKSQIKSEIIHTHVHYRGELLSSQSLNYINALKSGLKHLFISNIQIVSNQ